MLSIIRQTLSLVLAVLALRGIRWAYIAFVLVALLYFPAHVGFHLQPRPCELVFDARLAAFSLTNYAHIILFALFFILSSVHASMSGMHRSGALRFAAIATIVVGALVELAEGVTGSGHCRLRDLIPDSAGILIGAAAVLLFFWAAGFLKRHIAR
jgi:hypothetical protein